MRKYRILETIRQLGAYSESEGVTAEEAGRAAGILRHNASADLNELFRDGLLHKSGGRPVRFWLADHANTTTGMVNDDEATRWGQAGAVARLTGMSGTSRTGGTPGTYGRTDASVLQQAPTAPAISRAPGAPVSCFDQMIGAQGSLRTVVEQAKAAMLYPPTGLPTLIVGPTGAGKSHLAEIMYKYAVQAGRIDASAPFNVLNCADYAANPQLLLAQLFGYVKGAFTGAEKNTPGLIAESENGILFLDEIHRLPPDGQEMLFLLMDRGEYRMLGDGGALRRASITLIAATSEDPHSVLLKTMLRRFPVMITIPDLNGRPLEERLELIELFFQEEATRVGVGISVSPLVIVALLTFRTAGNIGELRSAVLLGCAKAFLNYIANGSHTETMPLYLTHLAPQIQLNYLRNHMDTSRAETVIGLEDRIYHPEKGAAAGESVGQRPTLDLYSELRARMNGYLNSGLDHEEVQKLIQVDVDYYLRRLLGRQADAPRLQEQFLVVVSDFVEEAGRQLGCVFGPQTVTGIALHLASADMGKGPDADRIMDLVGHCPREYGVVLSLADRLEKGLGIALSPGEAGFLSLFLATHRRSRQESPDLKVMVIAHGDHTASSMAAVANQLLGENRVIAVDMPLNVSVDETLQRAAQQLQEAGKVRGVLLLVDMGSLTGFGRYLERAAGVPVEVVPLVTTASVIEAGHLAGRSDVDLAYMVNAVKQIYLEDADQLPTENGRRVIITTCLTGQGTARKLAAFLAEALPVSLRNEVHVQPVNLDNGSDIPELLVEGWRGSVIAAAGTVDPCLPGVAFIGMEQILFGKGIETLISLAMGHVAEEEDTAAITREGAVELAKRYIIDSVEGPEGKMYADDADRSLRELEDLLGSRVSPSQAARWTIHFAFALERLTTDGPVLDCAELAFLEEKHGLLLDILDQAVQPVCRDRQVDMPRDEIGFLAQIILS
ncbi:sigma 54-interacting transcriptional regulator [Paenibacillus terreus]|uniref:Sigma 54-interacting transcriptional regulator n=1 Tax=Paenibacillus terreus TaxID=1387834 RepID=A0ABV5BCV9_9BACL